MPGVAQREEAAACAGATTVTQASSCTAEASLNSRAITIATAESARPLMA